MIDMVSAHDTLPSQPARTINGSGRIDAPGAPGFDCRRPARCSGGSFRLLLKSEGFQTETVNSPSRILSALEARDFDILLMILNYTRDTTSGEEGLELLTRIQQADATFRS